MTPENFIVKYPKTSTVTWIAGVLAASFLIYTCNTKNPDTDLHALEKEGTEQNVAQTNSTPTAKPY